MSPRVQAAKKKEITKIQVMREKPTISWKCVLLEATAYLFKEYLFIAIQTREISYIHQHTKNCLEMNPLPNKDTHSVGHASMIGTLLIEAPDISFDVTDEFFLVWKIRFPYQGTITKYPHARSHTT